MSDAAAPLVAPLVASIDPMDALERVADLPCPILLDSASDREHLGRYSFLSADPRLMVRSRNGRTSVWDAATRRWDDRAGDALGVAAELVGATAAALPGIPPFQGGAAGFIGYDWGGTLERLPAPRHDDLAVPELLLGIYDWVIAWDHQLGAAWIVSTGIPERGTARERRAAERLEQMRARVAGSATTPIERGWGVPEVSPAPSYPVVGVDGAEQVGLRSTFTHRGYVTAVSRVREYIVAGDIFQANLSQRFQSALREEPLALYRRLRRVNPAPFAAYLDYGDLTVLSASPERFLRLDAARRSVETRPIKGTRPRGLGPMHDAALARALSESEKDRAENVMIVDLLRNDLSRVCRPGTVRVPELFALEQHPTVHHLVSTVIGELAPDADAAELVRASFPGGSITGAPKVRAMEIIAELEPTRRGVYCGSIGYLSRTGDLDLSIVIRTYVLRHGNAYFQAGGGIVADSDPEAEYQETLDKARGLIRTLAGADC